MKNLFLIYILACMTSLFIFTSCEENADQAIKAQPDTTKEITTRTIEDCDDCPDTPEHCCCIVENLEDFAFNLLFCGIYPTTLGSICGPVTPPSPCSSISGISQVLVMAANSRQYFCVPNDGSFSIQRITGMDAQIRVTCNGEEIMPHYEGNLMDDDPWYLNLEGCDLMPCE